MGGMDEDKDEKEPDDSVMASLEAAEADKPPTDIDIGALTPPCSPIISVQRQRPLKQKQRFRFSMGEAIMSQNDILLNMCNFLGLKDFLNLYCVSKRFYVLVNSHYTTHIKQLARNHAPLAHTIFPYQHYKRACIYDPMQRTRPFHPSDAHPRSRSIILDPTTKAVVRTVPGLRWVLMCAYREALVSDMLLCLALEGHRFPAPVPGAVLKTWALLDQPFNGTRLATVHDPRAWSNRDLFLALMFFVKLDMRFSDPLLGAGECVLRRLLLGQKSLVVLWEALRGLNCRSQAEVLTLLVEWDCAVLRPGQRRSDKTVFGVPPGKVGALSREGWMQSGKPLLRPDQLVLREAVRRGLSMHRCFADFILWGYVDWTWVEDIPLPDLEQLNLMDRKGRGEDVEEDDEGGEDSGGDGGRKVSTGTMREMARASRVGSA
ncbi:gtp cyclohydrolase i [Neofusicoccum parvum]|uniref:Gtp cyclohydrolase i n=1 Tax=Neofusicoccum parvum TaxID=310453 RepID=A0ACB5SHV9_9PEZI|nr:gtp cyclohydrolase i [Neofusicoccum parvum]